MSLYYPRQLVIECHQASTPESYTNPDGVAVTAQSGEWVCFSPNLNRYQVLTDFEFHTLYQLVEETIKENHAKHPTPAKKA